MKPSKNDILYPVGIDKGQNIDVSVSQNFPNPVNAMTRVNVNVHEAGTLSLEVTNLVGQSLDILSKGNCNPGNYYFTINAKDYTPGVYFYTVTFNNIKVTKKMIVE